MTPSPTRIVPATKAIETILSPIPTTEPQNEHYHTSADTSFTTSLSTNFLNDVLKQEANNSEKEAANGNPDLSIDNDDDSGAEDEGLSADILEQSSNIMASIAKEQSPQGWPVPLDDNLTEGQQPGLLEGDAEVVNDARANGIRVRVVTWNQQAKAPPSAVELSKQLFKENKFHVIAIGTEECENSIAKSILVQSKKNWEAVVHAACGNRYIKLRSHTLQVSGGASSELGVGHCWDLSWAVSYCVGLES